MKLPGAYKARLINTSSVQHVFFMLIAITFVLLSSGAATAQEAQLKPIANPKLEISGEIEETTDFFGRKRFIGKIINKENKRIDFIKIEFTLRDREGNELEIKSVYIKGQFHRFRDRQETRSSLASEQIGTFDIIFSTIADLVYSSTHKLIGLNFIYP